MGGMEEAGRRKEEKEALELNKRRQGEPERGKTRSYNWGSPSW